MQHYSSEELGSMFRSVGTNVQIDRDVKFISPQNITLGSDIRIDSWCFFSALHSITIGNNVHIGHGSYFFAGNDKIDIGDFCGISSRVSLFTSTDDYTEGWLTNPTVPLNYRKLRIGPITLAPHVIIGSGSIIMPNCHLKFGASVGALSFVNKNIPECTIVSGNPPQIIGQRNRDRLLQLEQDFKNEKQGRNNSVP